jgi:hypothetical protein
MSRSSGKTGILFLAVLGILASLAGCQSAGSAAADGRGIGPDAAVSAWPSGGSPDSNTAGAEFYPTVDTTGSTPMTEKTVSAEDQTATADFDWRDIPVTPEISRRVIDIYRDGLRQGRNPHNFSVIGDCQAIPLVFMGPFERGELQPDGSEDYLWDAIRQYKGSFSRSGMAVRGGFNAASILSPLQADPHDCLSGETPLSCEYRLQNPSIVFIMLETWLDPGTIDRYEAYLHQILDYVIGKGSVPILMTKADSAELGNGVHVINPAIVRVASQYDVPVINFWRAAQNLDNGGIDPSREGFHLSADGFKLKNILALRALYKVWNLAAGSGDATATAEVPTASRTITPIQPGPSGEPFRIPDCEGGCIYFGSAVSHDGAVSPDGVLAINYQTRLLTRVLGEGFDLQDVSEDGRRLLVNNASRLYEFNLDDSSLQLISASLYSLGKQGAYWNADDSRIIFLDRDHPIRTDAGDEAISLYPSSRDEEIYFEAGSCMQKSNCQSGGLFRIDTDQLPTRMDAYSHPVFSPSGKWMAFLNPGAATKDNYFHIPYLLLEDADQGALSRKSLYFPGEKGFMVNPEVRDFAFSQDSGKLFILYDAYSDYYERSLRLHNYLYNIQTRVLSDFGEITGAGGSQNPRLAWAAGEEKVLLFLTDSTADSQYAMSVYEVDLETDPHTTAFAPGIVISDDYFFITNLYWRA